MRIIHDEESYEVQAEEIDQNIAAFVMALVAGGLFLIVITVLG